MEGGLIRVEHPIDFVQLLHPLHRRHRTLLISELLLLLSIELGTAAAALGLLVQAGRVLFLAQLFYQDHLLPFILLVEVVENGVFERGFELERRMTV